MHPRVSALLRETALYVLTIAAGMLVLIWAFWLPAADLRVPFNYDADGDTIFTLEMIKATVEHGWYFTDPNLNAPGTMDLHDFPMLDTLHFATFKLMGLFSTDPFLLINVFYLTGYPLTIVTCLIVFRHFGLRPLFASAASILYAFQPFHILRSNAHLFLATWQFIPLAIMLVIWVAQGAAFFLPDAKTHGWRVRPTSKGIAAFVILALIATTGVYYAYFTGILLVAAGLISAARRVSSKRIVEVLTLCSLLAGLMVAQAAPFLLYRLNHGRNAIVANRTVADVRFYSLEIPYLLTPVLRHRIPKVRVIDRQVPVNASRAVLFKSFAGISEGRFASIGVIGSLGYIALSLSILGLGYRITRHVPYLAELAKLNFAATIVAVQGGLGSLLAFVAIREIRAYNRISTFIAFLSLFAVATILNTLVRGETRSTARRRFIITAVIVGATITGIYDQIPEISTPDYSREQTVFQSDQKFIRSIEEVMPPRSQILQLPFMTFPEASAKVGLQSYALLRPTLHSHELRWSGGAVLGRGKTEQVRQLTALSPAEMVSEARRVGFAGILIQRDGFEDQGKSLEGALHANLRLDPTVSDDQKMSFFRLSPQTPN